MLKSHFYNNNLTMKQLTFSEQRFQILKSPPDFFLICE